MENSINCKSCYVDLKNVTAHELYDYVCEEMSFSKVIELYRLLSYKMHNLDDEPFDTISVAAYESK